MQISFAYYCVRTMSLYYTTIFSGFDNFSQQLNVNHPQSPQILEISNPRRVGCAGSSSVYVCRFKGHQGVLY